LLKIKRKWENSQPILEATGKQNEKLKDCRREEKI
jgi:hypothetical protein